MITLNQAIMMKLKVIIEPTRNLHYTYKTRIL